ncbi:MAG: 50S ribosomal protein L18, partial [Thermoplasmata archaeon]|nr:50S ribosomal protein L18 [Thermoplasmata archaeon]
DKAVLDIGLHAPTKGSKVYAVLKGMVDAGLDIPHDPSIIPDESRIKGETLGEDVPKIFESVSNNIRGGE